MIIFLTITKSKMVQIMLERKMYQKYKSEDLKYLNSSSYIRPVIEPGGGCYRDVDAPVTCAYSEFIMPVCPVDGICSVKIHDIGVVFNFIWRIGRIIALHIL